ncbi:MAG: glycosyltransferase family 1 protein [Chloroflexota bacterium]
MTLQIVVDGSVFHLQPYGGVSNIYNETLPRICDIGTDVLVYLVLQPQLVSRKIPEHSHIKRISIPPLYTLKPWRIWRYFTSPSLHLFYKKQVINFHVGHIKKTIYHSTYYETIPDWHGPQVVSVYDLIYEKFFDFFSENIGPEMKKKAEAIQSADWLLCISESTRNDLIEHYGINHDKTQVIHLGHHPIYSRRSVPGVIKIDYPFILYVGTRGKYKGFGDLVDAYARWEQKDKIRLLVAGPDWRTEETKRFRELNLVKNIVLMPNITDDMLADLYNQALAFIYPSYYEGFGIPLLEAMACGCPVVASKIPTSLEVAQSIPFYFDCGNLDSMINALDQAISTTKDSNRIAQGLDRSQQFSWDKTAAETLGFYRKISI